MHCQSPMQCDRYSECSLAELYHNTDEAATYANIRKTTKYTCTFHLAPHYKYVDGRLTGHVEVA